MRRKSSWLPDDREKIEPGRRHDFTDGDGRGADSPLTDLLGGALMIAGAVALVVWGTFSDVWTSTGGAVVLVVGTLALLAGAVYPAQRGLRRVAWRRRESKRTGRPAPRIWQQSPSNPLD